MNRKPTTHRGMGLQPPIKKTTSAPPALSEPMSAANVQKGNDIMKDIIPDPGSPNLLDLTGDFDDLVLIKNGVSRVADTDRYHVAVALLDQLKSQCEHYDHSNSQGNFRYIAGRLDVLGRLLNPVTPPGAAPLDVGSYIAKYFIPIYKQ